MLKIKLLTIAALLAFAVCGFLLPSNKIEAQSKDKNENRDEILQTVAGYKTWKQVQKPEKKVEDAANTDVFPIIDSAAMG